MLLLDRAYVSMARPGSRNEPLPRCPSLVEATDRFGLSSLLVAFLFRLRPRESDAQAATGSKPTRFHENVGPEKSTFSYLYLS